MRKDIKLLGLLVVVLSFLLICLTQSCGNTAKTTVAKTPCKGEAKKDCICTAVYQPVCGCDKVTYGNACEATCNGVTRYEKGVCEKK
jgi:hypothetical protein